MATQTTGFSIPVGPNIVRAWIDTVIGPLLDGLAEEEARLREHRWGWEPRPPTLRSARQLHEFLDVRALKNLEQIYDFVPDFKPATEEHDSRARALLTCFIKLQEELESSDELRKAHEKVSRTLPRGDGQDSSRLSGTGTEESDRLYLASYVLNGFERLYSYYVLAPMWNDHYESFLAIRESARFAEPIRSAEEKGDAFLFVVQKLKTQLEALWRSLSIQYDVPFFPSQRQFTEQQ